MGEGKECWSETLRGPLHETRNEIQGGLKLKSVWNLTPVLGQSITLVYMPDPKWNSNRFESQTRLQDRFEIWNLGSNAMVSPKLRHSVIDINIAMQWHPKLWRHLTSNGLSFVSCKQEEISDRFEISNLFESLRVSCKGPFRWTLIWNPTNFSQSTKWIRLAVKGTVHVSKISNK